MGGNRNAFWCPVANVNSSWDTNKNNSLSAVNPQGVTEAFGISSRSRFSYGYNDWGLKNPGPNQLGLGGDVNIVGEVKDAQVKRPVEMIVVTDSKPDGSFDGNIDPKEADQWPSNRHERRTVLNFADGHSEAARRKEVIDPANLKWRARWNNDNDPHTEITWTINTVQESRLDP
jgi:hypothetical protein